MITRHTFTHPDDAPEGHKWIDEKGRRVHIYDEIDGKFFGRRHLSGEWVVVSFGKSHTLRDAPKEYTFTGWVNVYAHRISGTFSEREMADIADSRVTHKRIACKEVTLTVHHGEGLEESE